jgi:hypothetical protein
MVKEPSLALGNGRLPIGTETEPAALKRARQWISVEDGLHPQWKTNAFLGHPILGRGLLPRAGRTA